MGWIRGFCAYVFYGLNAVLQSWGEGVNQWNGRWERKINLLLSKKLEGERRWSWFNREKHFIRSVTLRFWGYEVSPTISFHRVSLHSFPSLVNSGAQPKCILVASLFCALCFWKKRRYAITDHFIPGRTYQ
jgi:hypothetical protein